METKSPATDGQSPAVSGKLPDLEDSWAATEDAPRAVSEEEVTSIPDGSTPVATLGSDSMNVEDDCQSNLEQLLKSGLSTSMGELTLDSVADAMIRELTTDTQIIQPLPATPVKAKQPSEDDDIQVLEDSSVPTMPGAGRKSSFSRRHPSAGTVSSTKSKEEVKGPSRVSTPPIDTQKLGRVKENTLIREFEENPELWQRVLARMTAAGKADLGSGRTTPTPKRSPEESLASEEKRQKEDLPKTSTGTIPKKSRAPKKAAKTVREEAVVPGPSTDPSLAKPRTAAVQSFIDMLDGRSTRPSGSSTFSAGTFVPVTPVVTATATSFASVTATTIPVTKPVAATPSQPAPVNPPARQPSRSAVSRVEGRVCYNCRLPGHRYSQCLQQPVANGFCKRCGRRGYTVATCPRCGPQWEEEGPYVAALGRNVPRATPRQPLPINSSVLMRNFTEFMRSQGMDVAETAESRRRRTPAAPRRATDGQNDMDLE